MKIQRVERDGEERFGLVLTLDEVLDLMALIGMTASGHEVDSRTYDPMWYRLRELIGEERWKKIRRESENIFVLDPVRRQISYKK